MKAIRLPVLADEQKMGCLLALDLPTDTFEGTEKMTTFDGSLEMVLCHIFARIGKLYCLVNIAASIFERLSSYPRNATMDYFIV